MVDGEVSPNLLKQFGYWTHSVHHTVDGPVNTKNKEFSIIGSEFSLSKKSSLFLKMTIEDFSSEKIFWYYVELQIAIIGISVFLKNRS